MNEKITNWYETKRAGKWFFIQVSVFLILFVAEIIEKYKLITVYPSRILIYLGAFALNLVIMYWISFKTKKSLAFCWSVVVLGHNLFTKRSRRRYY